jgi:hypothetical protein
MALWAMRLQQNPSNPDQYYVMFGNGRIVPGGSDPPPALEHSLWSPTTGDDGTPGTVFHQPNATDPIFPSFQITNWNDIGGYQMTIWGTVFHFGSATAVTSMPLTVVYPYDLMIDFSMNPNGNGEGVMIDRYGVGYAISGLGGFGGMGIGWPTAVRLIVDWPSTRCVVFDEYGRRFSFNGAVSLTAGTFGPTQIASNGPIHRAIVVYDGLNTGQGHGWIVNNYGHTYWLNGSEEFYGVPQHEGWQWYYMDIGLIDDGTGANPVRLRLLDGFGNTFVVNNAQAPTVTVTEPSATVTWTTRPDVEWIYGQPQGNLQDEVIVRVFTSAQYGAGGFNPRTSEATWETTVMGARARSLRVVMPDVDLVNATYRAYVYVKSTADLSNSGDQFIQWVQSTVAPAAPTMTVVPGSALYPTTINLSAASIAGDYLRLDGTSGSRASTPDSAGLSITGDLDLRVKCSLDDWTPAAISSLLAKWLTTGNQRSYILSVLTTGVLRLSWSNNGTAELTADSTQTLAFTNESVHWVRATIDVDNGASGRTIRFYTSNSDTDDHTAVTWVQLGADVVQGTITSIFDSTAEVAVGGHSNGVTDRPTGNFYAAAILQGIAGTVRGSPVFGNTPHTDAQGNIWTFGGTAVLQASGRFYVEYHDGDDNWRYVKDGYAVETSGGAATVYDPEPPYGVERLYRARQAVADPFIAGVYTATKGATATSVVWTLMDTFTSTPIQIRETEYSFNRKVVAKDFWPDGRSEAVVVTGTIPIKGKTSTLEIATLDKTAFDALEDTVVPGHVLLLRNFFGETAYFMVTADISYELPVAAAAGQGYPIRHYHNISIPVTEVSRPLEGPDTGPLALLGES